MTGTNIGVCVSHNYINYMEIISQVSNNSAGAISTFIGTTRDHHKGKRVTYLEYEGYEAMAIKSLLKICEEAAQRWSQIYAVTVHHRLGVVPIGEASVMIAVSSAHRVDAMEAVTYIIDTLKAQTPIWKKEFYEDGTCSWLENCCKSQKVDLESVPSSRST
ncbi:hypothetical protein MIR68_010267 [Amoeboaphelidium protococcarum]|nr:hypothetical protein MIR68_010267 [Amoeboaphelidium protococcarum]